MKAVKRFNKLVDSGLPIQNRVCIAIPLTGWIRAEWMLARYGPIIPCNWSHVELIQWFDTFSPLSFAVDEARNLCVDAAVKGGFEWLLFIDHDVILPKEIFVKMNDYMVKGDIPVVSGLYNAKGNPPEPLLYRGRGNSYYSKWKEGDKVWVDGIPMGCALISMKLLKPMWEESEPYEARGQVIRKVFYTPRDSYYSSELGTTIPRSGTEDLWWCTRVIKEGWLKRTGFKKVASKQYPFLCDTSIKCGHIDNSGRIY